MTGDRVFLPVVGRFVKCTSLVRLVPVAALTDCREGPGFEGDICLFEMLPDATPIVVESITGRFMTLVAGDLFLATPGFRESTRWIVGHVPEGGVQVGAPYWVLADSGLVGAFEGASSRPQFHLGRARLLGVFYDGGEALNLAGFASVGRGEAGADRGVAVTVVVGTSSEVGKTTAGLAILQTMVSRGMGNVIAVKATGTASVQETARYTDFGAARTFDCVDFGLPTTYPTGREDIEEVFERALGTILSLEADAILMELGGDLFGANVPEFLRCLTRRRPGAKFVVAASDALAAVGSRSVLDGMGIEIDFFTGPCTDTPTLRARTERLTGRPAINVLSGGGAALGARGSGDADG